MRGSGNSDKMERRGWNKRRVSNADEEIGEIRKWCVDRVMAEMIVSDYVNGRQGNQWFDRRNRFQKDDRRFNDRGFQFRNGVKRTSLVERPQK
ncbi:hypothetical protein TNCV_3422311 [Trichonephila clavipes]|nr:hypothetical protein TNCV_3422311 [Trichonephila clavipes]